MSCRLKKAIGSGYSKPSSSDTLTPALEALKATRDAQLTKLFPPLAGSAVQTVNVIQRTEPPDFSNSLVSTSTKR